MSDHIVILLLGVIATGITTLTVKIIFDWIKYGRATPFTTQCVDCGKLTTTVSSLVSQTHEMETCMIQEKMKIRTIETELTEHEKRLEKGTAVIDEIKKDISEINKNLAVLLDRSLKRRREDFDNAKI